MKTSDLLVLQIFFHLLGDYITQSDWMADNKAKDWRAALLHATIYTLPFCLIAPDGNARAVIFASHFVIDHWRFAVGVVWFKNCALDPRAWFAVWHILNDRMGNAPLPPAAEKFCKLYDWKNCNVTGYPAEKPFALAIWLLIIVDNTFHLACNYLAIRFL